MRSFIEKLLSWREADIDTPQAWYDIHKALIPRHLIKNMNKEAIDRRVYFEMWLDTLDEVDLEYMSELSMVRPSLFYKDSK